MERERESQRGREREREMTRSVDTSGIEGEDGAAKKGSTLVRG